MVLLQLFEPLLGGGPCVLLISELSLQAPKGSLGVGESFEQLGCGRVGGGEFGLQPFMLALQPLDLFLSLLLISELSLEHPECGLGLPAGGFDAADSLEQLRPDGLGVSELCLQVLMVLLQPFELSLGSAELFEQLGCGGMGVASWARSRSCSPCSCSSCAWVCSCSPS